MRFSRAADLKVSNTASSLLFAAANTKAAELRSGRLANQNLAML
jgi:hypothetical protein